MRYLVFIPLLFFALQSKCALSQRNGDSKFEFTKSVFKIKGTVKKLDGDFVIVSDDDKDIKFTPVYLPEEYKKNGLEVTFDGDLGKPDKNATPLNIHKIWVAFELKEKYKLTHKQYELN